MLYTLLLDAYDCKRPIMKYIENLQSHCSGDSFLYLQLTSDKFHNLYRPNHTGYAILHQTNILIYVIFLLFL